MIKSILACLLAISFAACAADAPPPAPPPPAVTVAPVTEGDIHTTFRNVGRTVAVESVDLRARVAGFLERRAFEEGSDVRKGQLLFEIERAPYVATVNAAQAGIADAEAKLANARQFLERLRSVQAGAVAEADLDAAAAAAHEAEAGLDAARAQLESTRIDLGYTRITAPISGRIGRANVTEGNLVGPDSGVLATLVSLDPIYVTFSASERDVLDIRQQMIAEGSGRPTFVPRLELANGSRYPHAGEIPFIDNQVDPETGTLALRAVFPNPDRLLAPGQFVTVVAEREEARPVLLVPQKAVQQDQGGHSVLVVGTDRKVEARRVRLGERQGTAWTVESGLEAGEMVIVEGVQKVRPGAEVTPTPVTAVPPTAAPVGSGSAAAPEEG